MYDSSDLYDFDASLAEARVHGKQLAASREALQMKDEGEYWRLFNSGGTYREVTFGYGYPTKSKLPEGSRVVSVTADAEKMKRHEEKFAGTKAKRQRRSTPNVKGQVLELHSRGVVTPAIADTLNLSDRRVKEIIRTAAA